MANITFLMLPEPGHLLPTLRIASGLRLRRHTIKYLTIPQYRGMIEQSGFQFCPVIGKAFADSRPNNPLREEGLSGRRISQLLMSRVLADGNTLENELVKDVMESRSDLLLLDSSLAGLWPPTLESCELEDLGCPIIRVNVTFGEETDAIPSLPFLKRLPELILCPRDFDGPWSRKCNHARYYVEPSVFRSRVPKAFPWQFLADGKALVYCSLGTQSSEYPEAFNVLRTVMESVRLLPSIQLIVAAGCHFEALAATDVPANVLLRSYVPQLELMSRCRAVVTHAGLGTVKEAIMAAVPMVAVPFTHDQPLNAARIEYHEVGGALPTRGMNVDMVTAALGDVIDSKLIAERCRELQEVFTRIEAESPSLGHIEAQLQ